MSKPSHDPGKTGTCLVDVARIAALHHQCDGCLDREAGCCASFEVCVAEPEMERILGTMEAIAEFCPDLHNSEGFAYPFDETEDDLHAIDTDEDGLCAFAYSKDGRTLCGIHSAAERLDVPWFTVKPRSCVLWPLALSHGPSPVLTVDPEAPAFHCCEVGRRDPSALDDNIAGTLRTVFGEAFEAAVGEAAARGEERVTVAFEDIA
ncbi:MAG: hypothetical protein GY851_12880 [bacterium]|nr:hypothetical protein [bacterium]